MRNVPGTNLLNKAFTKIRQTTIQYFQFTGRAKNSIGLLVSTYASAVDVRASVQAVRRTQYQRMGLDYSKRYIMIWTSADVQDLFRDRSGDQVAFNGRRYELMNEDDWTVIDQWNSVLAIEVDDA